MVVVLKQHSELITHQVAAAPIPSSSLFVTVRDENGLPLIISLGSNGVLYAFKENSTGARVMMDLNKAFGIAEQPVTAFDMSQGADDRLYLAFSHVQNPNSKKTPLVMTLPFSPTEFDTAAQELDLKHLVMPEGGAGTETSIEKIYMGPKAHRSHYPDVFLGYTPLADVHKSADIARVHIASDFNHWCVMSDLELPENASQIVDFCPAFLRVGGGFFLLYVIAGEMQLLFSTVRDEDGFTFQVSLECPKGAKCLATTQDAHGYSSLLVGGAAGLWHWDTQNSQRRNRPGRLLSSDEAFEEVTRLYTAQNPDGKISVFASNADLGLSYFTTSSPTFGDPLDIVPLVPEGKGGIFSPFVASRSDTQQLVVCTPDATELTLLQQDMKSGAWSAKALFIPVLDDNIEFDAYMTCVAVKDDTGRPVAGREFVLESEAGWVDIFVNGRSVLAGPDGTKVETDSRGVITLIVPTADIQANEFCLSEPELIPDGYVVDPMAKTNEKLAALGSGDALRGARTSEGKPLLDGAKLSDGEIDEVGRALGTVHREAKRLREGKAEEEEDDDDDDDDDDEDGEVIVGTRPNTTAPKKKAKKRFRHYLREAWNNFKDDFKTWWVEKVGRHLVAVFEVAGKAWRMVIKRWNDFIDMVTMVWDKIVDGFKRLVEFIKFLFNWHDILNVKNFIVDWVNGGIDNMLDRQAGIESKTSRWFDGLRRQLGVAEYEPDLQDEATKDDPAEGVDELDDESSTSLQYTMYQVEHGGAMNSSVPQNRQEAEAEEKQLSGDLSHASDKAAEQVASDLDGKDDGDKVDSLEEKLGSTGDNFSNGTKMSRKSLFETIRDALVGAGINLFEDLTLALIRGGFGAIAAFRDVINKKIKVPIFSKLYKQISGRDLTVLDFMSLILAIPTTVIAKVAFKLAKKPWKQLRAPNLSKKKTASSTARMSTGQQQVSLISGASKPKAAALLSQGGDDDADDTAEDDADLFAEIPVEANNVLAIIAAVARFFRLIFKGVKFAKKKGRFADFCDFCDKVLGIATIFITFPFGVEKGTNEIAMRTSAWAVATVGELVAIFGDKIVAYMTPTPRPPSMGPPTTPPPPHARTKFNKMELIKVVCALVPWALEIAAVAEQRRELRKQDRHEKDLDGPMAAWWQTKLQIVVLTFAPCAMVGWSMAEYVIKDPKGQAIVGFIGGCFEFAETTTLLALAIKSTKESRYCQMPTRSSHPNK
ncbi:hypothetical protein B0T14DRAFT_508339 [Immersiella caudata]|uniref:Uncharacterized protein n=1 Tax=Immersiella caudata TaxID=314043 RepID=A0AA40CD52_9PEZI|nr:hypothetical protein B0T14DRAFT_508339 [Immersiella caudata]